MFSLRNSKRENPEGTVHFNQATESVSIGASNAAMEPVYETGLNNRPPAPTPRAVLDMNNEYFHVKENPTTSDRDAAYEAPPVMPPPYMELQR